MWKASEEGYNRRNIANRHQSNSSSTYINENDYIPSLSPSSSIGKITSRRIQNILKSEN
ncbi:hypothetical protein SNEBB_003179 [Seison nebaliae]|nr:hypothetical protein SNEBB_003179 [Seison nebaliae]